MTVFYVGQVVISKASGRRGIVTGLDKRKPQHYAVKAQGSVYSVHEAGLEAVPSRLRDNLQENDLVYCPGLKKQGRVIGVDDKFKDFFKVDFDGLICTFNVGALEKIFPRVTK